MRTSLLFLPLAFAVAACGGDPALPTPDGESALIVVSYPSGSVDTMDVTDISTQTEMILVGEDTTYCVRIHVDGVLPPPPGEGEDPVVDLSELRGCGATFDVPPSNWSRNFTDGAELQAQARAASVGYMADSGSATIRRLGGGFVETEYHFRFAASGSDLPPAFRIAADVVAQWEAFSPPE